jgi:hypothetical protein
MTATLRTLPGRRALPRIAALTLLSASAAVFAAPQVSYLEQAQTYGIGTKYQSFRVPTTDVNGKVGYWDVTVLLGIDATGKPEATAQVAATKSKNFNGNKVIQGPYMDQYGSNCTVTAIIADSGRQEGSLTCYSVNYAEDITATWFNGPIVGHPDEPQLEAAGIDKLPDPQDFAWGLVGSTYGNHIAWYCFAAPGILSASQVGPKLTLTFYGNANAPLCAMTLTLQTP